MRVDVYSRHDAYLATLGPGELLGFVHTDELNGEDSVDVTTTFALAEGMRLVWRDNRGTAHEHVCQDPKGERKGGATVYSDTALNSICELFGDYIVDKRPYGYSFANALQVALEPTRWAMGTVDQPGTVSSGLTFYHTSAREALNAILECGGELETVIEVSNGGVSARKACIRRHRGDAAGHRRFANGKDLIKAERTEHWGAITACYGYGKGIETGSGGYGRKLTFGDVNGGQDYVEDAAALKAYGRPDGKGGMAHVFGTYENSDCEDAAQLLAETRAYLDEHKVPGVTYKVDVADLVAMGRTWEGVGVGDDAQIVDTCFSPALRCEGRVTKMETDCLGGTCKVTLGNVAETFADMFAQQQQAVSSLSRRSSSWDVAASTPAAYLQQLLSGLNERFNLAGMSYMHASFEHGLITASVPLDENGNPTKTPATAMQMCSQGFRIASQTKADGTFDWQTFGTGEGFFANMIVAGILDANLIKAGIIQDATGDSYWNLETGDVRMVGYVGEADAITAAVPQYTWSSDGKTPASDAEWYESPEDLWKLGKSDVLQRIMYTHADGSVTYSDPVLYVPKRGAAGTIVSTTVEYYLSTSSTEQSGGKWTSVLPTWTDGCFYWTRQRLIWSDRTSVTYTSPRLMTGLTETNRFASALNQDLTDLNGTVTSLAEDGVVTEAEKAAVEKVLQAMEKEQAEVKREYESLYGNSSLSTEFKSGTLKPRYIAAFGSDDEGGTYGSLKSAISNVVKCETAEALKKAMYEYESAYSSHASAVKAYLAAAESARHAIEQKDAADYADGILSDYDEQMNQKEIFDRLTNNGATQGIYMSNGLLYVNASYMATGTIADKLGRNSWNLTTGTLKTNYMTANNITANGTFKCGYTNWYTMLTSAGELAGYRTTNGSTPTKVGYIDYTASMRDTSTGAVYYGIQMQAQGSVRISSPIISTAATSDRSVTTTYGRTGSVSQPLVSEVHDNGNGTVGWHYGTFVINTINGLFTSYSTVGTG